MLHRANTALPSTMTTTSTGVNGATARAASPRVMKPDFRENSVVEERDRSGRVISRFRCGRLLGRGGFAKCFEFTDMDTPNAPMLACKVIDRASLVKSKTLQKLHSEIAIHKRMKHKNIVNFIRTFQDDWFVYILLEKCSMQTLMEVSKTRTRFSVPETQFIMIQSIAAIQYMHDQYVIHRDLKLGNMMMDENMNVKIGDFGLAAELQYDGERKRTICGTPNYIAPEILEGHRDGHSYEVDVWSLGVILYTLLVGEPPFQTSDVKTTYDRIKRCRYEFPPNVQISQAGKELVHKILQSRPDRRPTLVEIRNDEFFKTPVPPTIAPITLFPEHVRRRLEREGYGATGAASSAPMSAAPVLSLAGSGKSDSARDPLRPLWSTNQQAPSAATAGSARPSPRESGGSAPTSARYPTPTSAAPAPLTSGYGAANIPLASSAEPVSRPRTGSLPIFPKQQARAADVGGWCAPLSANTGDTGRAASPRSTAAAGAIPAPAANKRQLEDDEEKHHLTAIHDKLHQTICGTLEDDPHTQLVAPSIWITDYADFSSKYGLTYKLSSGHTGVHFNDSTKMVWEPITGRCEYYARIKETINGVVHAQDQRQGFVMETFPESLTKKVTLIKYFKSYLSRVRGAREGSVEVFSSPFVNTTPSLLSEPNMVSDMVYVKRWIVNPEAMIFRLSNKTIQVAFKDRTEVILSSESKVVTYTDASGRRRTMLLSSVASQSEEVAGRLKYTRDILCKLINNREL